MTLNKPGLTNQELIRLIAERCAEFGSVESIRILDLERATTDQFAVVRMSTPTEASTLSRAMRGSNVGDSVLLRLEQSY